MNYNTWSNNFRNAAHKHDRDLFVFWLLLGAVLWLSGGCALLKKHSRRCPIPEIFYNAGHRGARGLMPEETIPAMKKGLLEGANTLEFDLYVTKDDKLILHHDPSFNPDFEFLPDGSRIPASARSRYILYKMDYADIRSFVVGGQYYPDFPEQQRMASYVPLLSEMIDSIEQFIGKDQLPTVYYMPQIGGTPAKAGVTNPSPAAFVQLLMAVLKPYLPRLKSRLIIQSFSALPLQLLHQQYPEIALAYLTASKTFTFEENIKRLTFNPDFYLPYFKLVTPTLVEQCHENNIKIVPWTVNDTMEMKRLMDLQVDGIITDYPDRLAKLRKEGA